MKVQVCTGKTCREKFSNYILKRLENDKENFKLDHLIIETCACQKKCEEAPIIIIDGKIEVRMTGIKASKLIMERVKGIQKRSGPEVKKEFHREDPEGDLEKIYIGK